MTTIFLIHFLIGYIAYTIGHNSTKYLKSEGTNMDELYSEYMSKKDESSSESQLRELYLSKHVVNENIAKLFNIPLDEAENTRKKYGLTLEKINRNSKERLLAGENFDRLVVGLAHYFFRNGPVEEMHANGKLSNKDMKVLNKYMVDHIAHVLLLAKEDQWFELKTLLHFHMQCGSTWDKPNPNIDKLY